MQVGDNAVQDGSVITFYAFNSVDMTGMDWIDAGKLFDLLPPAQYSCRNVFRFDVSPEVLKRDIKEMLASDGAFKADVARLVSEGVNYMFINSAEGAVWGCSLPRIV